MGVEEKIARAFDLFGAYGHLIMADKECLVLLEKLNAAILASRAQMEEVGLIQICSACETAEGGSCCGEGIENKYDEWLILINILLGVTVPRTRYDRRSCYFLGPEGCVLKARHVICINYVCEKVTTVIDPFSLAELREREGLEIEALFLLNERIKKIIKTSA